MTTCYPVWVVLVYTGDMKFADMSPQPTINPEQLEEKTTQKKIIEYAEKIIGMDQKEFIKNFFAVKKVLNYLYNEQYIYKRPTDENEELIKKIENALYQKIEENSLPYIYELLINEYTKTKPSQLFNQSGKSVSRLEISKPLRVSDKFGQEFFVLSYDGKIKTCKKENEENMKEWLGYSEMYAHDYVTGVKEVYNKYFTEQINLQDLDLKQEDLATYTLFLSDDCQSIITNLFQKSIQKNEGRYASDLKEKNQEGFYFTKFFSQCDKNTFLKVESFSKKYSFDGLRTFLSIEHGGKEMGDKIITLGEKLPQESAKVLFHTYSQMIDATEEISTLLKENLKENASPEIIEQSKESLLIAGKDLLEKYADKASVCVDTECDTLGKELVERLTLAKSSVFAFSYACKTLVENGEFSFEDFKKAKLSYDTSPLPEKMKQDIVAMHQENTKQYPETLRDTWRKTLADGLEKENPNQMIVSVSYDDDVVSAMRILKQADDSWYGASFNVNPTIQGSRIGTELLKKVIQDLAKDKPFVADCYSKNPMLETYINKFGFQITNEIPNYENTGELVYKITLFPEVKEGLQPDPSIHQK
jgi:hypothetical protein